jgi:bacterioferritin-associated ferredoxin
MIICSCNVISDHDIRDVVVFADVKLGSTAQGYDCLGCLVQCGLCSRSVRRILEEQPASCPEYQGSPDRAVPQSF